MGKIRINVKSNFTQVSNHVLHNTNLSLKAKGLYTYMVSLPESWDYSVEGLTKVLKEGKSAIGEALKELEREGYLVRTILRQGGRFSDLDYMLNAEPSPFTGFPDTEFSAAENQQQYNTIIGNTVENKSFPNGKERSPEKKPNYDTVLSAPENEYIKEALVTWIKTCKDRGIGFQYKTLERWASTLRENAGDDPAMALAIVNQSIDAGWKNLYKLKRKPNTRPKISCERFDPTRDKLAVDENGNPIVF